MPARRSRSYLLENEQHRRIEADRLDLQARLLFPLERDALVRHGIVAGQTLVDLGCGQGSYLALVAGAFAGIRCIGLDRNTALLEQAASRPGIAAVAECDLADTSALARELRRHRPDAVLCRFVLQHMSPAERQSMLRTLAQNASPLGLRIVLADVDAASSFVEPPSQLVADARAGLSKLQERHGGDRRIGGRLGDLLAEAGFRDVQTSRVRVTTDALGFEAWWAAFGSLLCAGLGARPSAQEALRDWAKDPATPRIWRAGFEVVFASSDGPARVDG